MVWGGFLEWFMVVYDVVLLVFVVVCRGVGADFAVVLMVVVCGGAGLILWWL